MKFVVPFTMPSTRWTFVATSASRSTLTTGIAAHTLASKRSCTPASEAAAKRSAPRRATSCLFADTTGVPGRRSERAHAAQPVARGALEVVGALAEHPVHGGPHRPVAEQRDRDVNRRRGPRS